MSDFSGPQETALVALASGADVTEAAQAAGVRRETVSRWLNGNDAFADEVERRRAALWDEHKARITRGLGEALDGLYILMHGPEYYGCDKDGRSFYDPRVRLDAIKFHFLIAGFVPSRPALQINNLLAQQITPAKGE